MSLPRTAALVLLLLLLTASGCAFVGGTVGGVAGVGLGFLAAGPRGAIAGGIVGAGIGAAIGAGTSSKEPLSTAELLREKLPANAFRGKRVGIEILPTYRYGAEYAAQAIADNLQKQGAEIVRSDGTRSPNYVLRIVGEETSRMIFIIVNRNGKTVALRASQIRITPYSSSAELASASRNAAHEALAALYE